MSCQTYKEMLHSYVDHSLNELELTAVQKHIDTCAVCHNEVMEIERLKGILNQMKPELPNLDSLKINIIAAIKTTKKVKEAVYDAKVVWRLGASLVACGMLVMVLNFTGFNAEIKVQDSEYAQPLAFISKGLSDMSDTIFKFNGITIRLEHKLRGGM